MSPEGDDLIRDSPYAAPGIVDVVADPVRVPNGTSPLAEVIPDAPLADVVRDIVIEAIEHRSHLLMPLRRYGFLPFVVRLYVRIYPAIIIPFVQPYFGKPLFFSFLFVSRFASAKGVAGWK